MFGILRGIVLIAVMTSSGAAFADDDYLCETPSALFGPIKVPLVVKYSGSVATEILSTYKRQTPDLYRIKERNEIYYEADEVSPDSSDSFTSFKINRLSGELEIINRISKEAVQLLANICDGKIQGSECGDRMEKIMGGQNWELP